MIDETRFITVPEGLIAQGHNGNYAAKIIINSIMCKLFFYGINKQLSP